MCNQCCWPGMTNFLFIHKPVLILKTGESWPSMTHKLSIHLCTSVQFGSVRFSSLTTWVMGDGAWRMYLQRSSPRLPCRRPLWSVLAWAGTCTLWCCPSSISSTDHSAAHPPRCPEEWFCWDCHDVWHSQSKRVGRRGSCGLTRTAAEKSETVDCQRSEKKIQNTQAVKRTLLNWTKIGQNVQIVKEALIFQATYNIKTEKQTINSTYPVSVRCSEVEDKLNKLFVFLCLCCT